MKEKKIFIQKNSLIQIRNFHNLPVFNAFKFIKMRFAAFYFSSLADSQFLIFRFGFRYKIDGLLVFFYKRPVRSIASYGGFYFKPEWKFEIN